nr:S-linalool synthase-like [Tanacetum cinerariifolium]
MIQGPFVGSYMMMKSWIIWRTTVDTSTSLPHDSIIRMLVAKIAIVITVADDFFDMRSTLEELHVLTDAVYRWDSKGLNGPSKAIFDVLDDLVTDTTKELVLQGKIDVTEDFRDLVGMKIAKITKKGSKPDKNEHEIVKSAQKPDPKIFSVHRTQIQVQKSRQKPIAN